MSDDTRQVTIMGEKVAWPRGDDRFDANGVMNVFHILGPDHIQGGVDLYDVELMLVDDELRHVVIAACEAAIVHFEGKAETLAEARQACIHETRGIINPERFSNVSAALKRELDTAKGWRRILEKVRAEQ